MTRLAIAAALALLVAPSLARAQPVDPDAAERWSNVPDRDDYDPDNNKWNGLTTFVALARGMGISVEMRRELDWPEVGKDDLLIVLYPTSRIVPRHLSSFVRGGGTVVLGDDFGRSNRLFAELGMLRSDGVGAGAKSYYNDLAFAPIAEAVGQHPLSDRAPSLATNHPAIFAELGFTSPIYRFGRSETVVAAGDLGSGRLVALADPSVLINRMLQFDDNFQFAVNLLRYLGERGSRRLILVTGRFTISGEPVETDRMAEGFNGVVGVMNEWLGGINEYVATRSTARGLAILAAGAVAFMLLLIVPLRAKSELDGNWIRARPLRPEPLSGERIVALLDDTRARRQSFALAATALRDGVARRLADELNMGDPFHGVPEHVLYQELEKLAGVDAVARLRPVYRQLKALPSREHAASDWDSRSVSQREFERLGAAVDQLYRSLVRDPEC